MRKHSDETHKDYAYYSLSLLTKIPNIEDHTVITTN